MLDGKLARCHLLAQMTVSEANASRRGLSGADGGRKDEEGQGQDENGSRF